MAALSGAFLLRYQGFTLLMLTVAVAQILQNLASKLRDLTGAPTTASPASPWARCSAASTSTSKAAPPRCMHWWCWWPRCTWRAGWSIHPSAWRCAASTRTEPAWRRWGTPVFARLLAMYTMAGALAGAAGALSAQTNAIVGLDSLGFAVSAEALVMLILGGAGRLTGALVGAAVFTLLHHTAASINPYHWLFVIGAMLMGVVLLPPGQAWAWLRSRLGARA